MPTQKVFDQLLTFVISVSTWKRKVIQSVYSSDTVNCQSPETRLATPIFDHPQPKKFQSTFNFWEFVSP